MCPPTVAQRVTRPGVSALRGDHVRTVTDRLTYRGRHCGLTGVPYAGQGENPDLDVVALQQANTVNILY